MFSLYLQKDVFALLFLAAPRKRSFLPLPLPAPEKKKEFLSRFFLKRQIFIADLTSSRVSHLLRSTLRNSML